MVDIGILAIGGMSIAVEESHVTTDRWNYPCYNRQIWFERPGVEDIGMHGEKFVSS